MRSPVPGQDSLASRSSYLVVTGFAQVWPRKTAQDHKHPQSMVYLPTLMANLHGKLVGKYTIHGMFGDGILKKTPGNSVSL